MEGERTRLRSETEARPGMLRRENGGQWKKVVVDVTVTSTDKMNDEFKKKDDKYREWTT